MKGPYCTLSYRWPKENRSLGFVLLTKENRRRLEAGISPKSLLPEIQDAIKLAKSLGFDYLWVDALVKPSRGMSRRRC